MDLLWTKFENSFHYIDPDEIKKLSLAPPVHAGAWGESALLDFPFLPDDKSLGYFRHAIHETLPETGFDNYERWSPATETVVLEDPPWQMLPASGNATDKRVLELTHLYSALKVTAAPPALTVTPTQLSGLLETPITLGCDTTAGNDESVALSGTDTSSKVAIVHTARLPKIECVVQPYKVIWKDYPISGHNKDPQNMPSRQELEEGLNKIYETQVNVHFIVNEFIPLGPLHFDVGAGALYSDQYPTFAGNRSLDILSPQRKVTDEENAVYDAALAAGGPVNDATVIKIYFVPTTVLAYESFSPVAGISRIVRKSAFISECYASMTDPLAPAKASASMIDTVGHEIGHLGMGLGGENAVLCLLHPRAKGVLNPYDLSGFPLRKLSDDLKRLLWWESDKLDDALLIKDEWMKFRASKMP